MFTQLLKQNTAATLQVGPLVDATDGFTLETALTVQKADVKLSKGGAAVAAAHADQGASDAGAAHDAAALYSIALDATDTNTLGRLDVVVHKATSAGCKPFRASFTVVTDAVYKQLVLGTEDIGEEATDARIWYVRTTGNDANDGQTVGTAFLTINAAAAHADSGDTISADAASMNAAGVDFSAVKCKIVVDA